MLVTKFSRLPQISQPKSVASEALRRFLAAGRRQLFTAPLMPPARLYPECFVSSGLQFGDKGPGEDHSHPWAVSPGPQTPHSRQPSGLPGTPILGPSVSALPPPGLGWTCRQSGSGAPCLVMGLLNATSQYGCSPPRPLQSCLCFLLYLFWPIARKGLLL